MAENNDAVEKDKPVPGPGVTVWLQQTAGPPRPSRATGRPWLPPGLGGGMFSGQRIELMLPEEVVLSEGGSLQRIEIRGLPKDVTLTGGFLMDDGFWYLAPEDLYGVAALVPGSVDLPFSVILKGVFVGDDVDAPWSELTGYEIVAADNEEQAGNGEPASEPGTVETKTDESVAAEKTVTKEKETPAVSEPEPISAPAHQSASEMAPGQEQPVTMVVIDLDVSVGTEDPGVLESIAVRFSGLPAGALLSTGTNDDGTWTVPATELADLSIIIPEGTPDFELDVEMDIAGAPTQSAAINVENPPQDVDPGNAFQIFLTGSTDTGMTRVTIYTDGSPAYDRVINWAVAPARKVPLLVPFIDSGIPFEIVMRYGALTGDDRGPFLSGLEIDGTDISADTSAITSNGTMTAAGLSWSGDLVVDVRAAMKPALPEPIVEPVPENANAAHEPPETSEPSFAASAPAALPEETVPRPENMLAPTDTPALDDTAAADADAVDVVAEESFPDALSELQGPEETAPTADNNDVLVVDATYSDLQRPAFITELRNLRDFIRTRTTDVNGEIYGRLGIDVTKWHDKQVHGPSGAVVDLEPRLPEIAPLGGIDNTRDLIAVNVSNFDATGLRGVRISGLPAGALLTRGRNLGNGEWQLTARECNDVRLLPPIAAKGSIALHLARNDGSDDKDAFSLEKSLIVGQRRARMQRAGTDMLSMTLRLDAETFDPEGHGALSLTVGEMPAGVILSRGRNHGGGVWTVEASGGDELEMLTAAAMKSFDITLTCVALNAETGESTVVSRIVEVTPGHARIKLRTDQAA